HGIHQYGFGAGVQGHHADAAVPVDRPGGSRLRIAAFADRLFRAGQYRQLCARLGLGVVALPGVRSWRIRAWGLSRQQWNRLYGDYGLSLGGVLAGVVIFIYNTLSVVVLAIYSPGSSASVRSVCISILRNPLIIGVASAIPFAYWQVELPLWLLTSAGYFAQL